MGNTKNSSYPFKVWLTTLFLAPIIFSTVTILKNINAGFDNDIFAFMAFAFIYGMIMSVPTFTIYYIVYYNLKNTEAKKIKLKLCGIALVGMFLSIFFFFGKHAYNIYKIFQE